MKKYIFIVLICLVAAASVFTAIWYTDNRRPNFTQNHVLYVYPDMTSDDFL